MSAILVTDGSINTYEAFKASGPEWLRHVSKETYQTAAKKLEVLGAVQITRVRKTDVVVKKPPEEITEILEKNKFLCSPMEYQKWYEHPLPDAILASMRRQMAKSGHLDERYVI